MVRVRVRCPFHAVSSSRLGLWREPGKGEGRFLVVVVVGSEEAGCNVESWPG
jgi:hypothetical protein